MKIESAFKDGWIAVFEGDAASPKSTVRVTDWKKVDDSLKAKIALEWERKDRKDPERRHYKAIRATFGDRGTVIESMEKPLPLPAPEVKKGRPPKKEEE